MTEKMIENRIKKLQAIEAQQKELDAAADAILEGSPGKEIDKMALTTARKKANAKYEAKAYDKTLIRLPKGRLDEIRAHIEPPVNWRRPARVKHQG